MKQILHFLMERYHPTGMILYGSYASGTYDAQSDFDALLILEKGERIHDTSLIDGVRMDVFGYSEDYLRDMDDPEEILQIHGGQILLDRDGLAASLLKKVEDYTAGRSQTSPEDKRQLRFWCGKMLARAERNDPEGRYRGHWLLTDSLSIYCELRDRFYFGPKKTIAYLEKSDPEGYRLFCAALERQAEIPCWIEYVCKENGLEREP